MYQKKEQRAKSKAMQRQSQLGVSTEKKVQRSKVKQIKSQDGELLLKEEEPGFQEELSAVGTPKNFRIKKKPMNLVIK